MGIGAYTVFSRANHVSMNGFYVLISHVRLECTDTIPFGRYPLVFVSYKHTCAMYATLCVLNAPVTVVLLARFFVVVAIFSIVST